VVKGVLMSSFEIRNLLGLRDGKRVYMIDQNHVSKEEYEYCQVLNRVVWGDKGMVETLGPTWNMILDPRFEVIENKFVIDRAAVFGGDARLGKQYVDGNSIMSHSMAELETYAEILGEGRHFRKIIMEDGLDPQTFHTQAPTILWKYIHQECPNYFDNVKGEPNKVALRLFDLFKADLVGLVDDYAELPFLNEWVKVETGEVASETDHANTHEEPLVFAEIDMLERALTMRSSLRVTAVKILDKSGLMKLLEKKYELTDYEIDQILKIIYTLEYDKLYEAPAQVMNYVNSISVVPYETRLAKERVTFSAASKDVIEKLKSGEIKPVSLNEQEEIDRDLTPEEKQIVAIKENPHRLELFMMLVEAEMCKDAATIALLTPMLDDTDTLVTEETVASVKTISLKNRTASAARNAIGMN
jgi:hypothetical protein